MLRSRMFIGISVLVLALVAGTTASYFRTSLLGQVGGNGFATKTDYAVGQNPTEVVAGDVNGDGKNDVVAVNSANNTFSVLMNNGNGTFANKVDYSATTSPTGGIAIGDVNNDG